MDTPAVGSESETSEAVSYTHLDVYKRQGRGYRRLDGFKDRTLHFGRSRITTFGR